MDTPAKKKQLEILFHNSKLIFNISRDFHDSKYCDQIMSSGHNLLICNVNANGGARYFFKVCFGYSIYSLKLWHNFWLVLTAMTNSLSSL